MLCCNQLFDVSIIFPFYNSVFSVDDRMDPTELCCWNMCIMLKVPPPETPPPPTEAGVKLCSNKSSLSPLTQTVRAQHCSLLHFIPSYVSGGSCLCCFPKCS